MPDRRINSPRVAKKGRILLSRTGRQRQEQYVGLNLQGLSNFAQDHYRWISYAPFDTAYVCPVKLAFKSQLFLGPFVSDAQPRDIFSHLATDIHIHRRAIERLLVDRL